MKLIAKKGSSLEEQIKNDYEKKMRTQEEALSFIEKKAGIRPSGIGYTWALGYTCSFSSQLLAFEQEGIIDRKFFIRNNKCNECYKINIRTKAGKQLSEGFKNLFDKIYLDYRPYSKYGISFSNCTTYYWWEPHKEAGQYMIICGKSMTDKLKKVDNAQYTILP